jgi:hypothetical protein
MLEVSISHYSECLYAECHSTDSRGAIINNSTVEILIEMQSNGSYPSEHVNYHHFFHRLLQLGLEGAVTFALATFFLNITFLPHL